MKKFLAFGAAMLLGLGAFAGANKYRMADATNGDTVHDIILSYKNAAGQYTKKSELFLNTAAVADIAVHFHARYVSLERTTYYDETVDALLMGDYDGGFDDINSGYRKNGANMEHFSYSGYADPSIEHIFEGSSDYKVNDTTPNAYFVNLTALANAAYTAHWESFDNNGYTTYKYTVGELTVTDGAYNDATLNAFQYFAAPLLLRDNYITYNSIWVTQAASFLSIRLYASKTDSGKSTVTPGANDVLIAESRVYKGLSFTPEAKWYLMAGETKDHIDDEFSLTYQFDAYNPEQYKITHTFGKLDWFYVTDKTTNYGFDAIENQAWFGKDNADSTIASTVLSGEHSIYWKPNTHKMYIASPDVSYTFNCTSDWDVDKDGALFYAWAWKGSEEGNWYALTGGSKSYSGTIPSDLTKCKIVRMNPGAATIPSWDASWNESSELAIGAGNDTISFSL